MQWWGVGANSKAPAGEKISAGAADVGAKGAGAIAPCPGNDMERQLLEWLQGMDGGKGALVKYFDVDII